MHALAVCIVSRSEDFAEEGRYTPESYRKAAYRQFVMWQLTWVPGEVQQKGAAILCGMECQGPLSCS